MNIKEFQARLDELLAANPKGVPTDDYLDLMVEMIGSAMEAGQGHPCHVTLLVGARINEVKVCSTLSDDDLLLMLAAFSETMALKHAPAPPGKSS